ncbi:MAG: portal protein, partial [Alphaproteobacteria bacterium]
NYIDYDAVPAGRRPLEPLITGANLPIGLDMENQRRDMIWAAFFRNVLQLPINAPQMTATEILERKEEFLRVIGPTFGRLESSYIAPIVNRAFGLMKRAGAFAPPPEILRGRRISFAFDSPVSQARKQIEALAVRGALEQAAPFINLNPAAADLINSEDAVRAIFAANGADGLLLGEDALAQIRATKQVAQIAEAVGDVVAAVADGSE